MRRVKTLLKLGAGTSLVGGGAALAVLQRAYSVPEENKRPRPDAKTAIVIGGGVVGFAQARELCRNGYQVTVLETEPGPAKGASAAPAGHISVSAYHSSFASIGFVRQLGLHTFFNDPRLDMVDEPDDLAHNKFVKLPTWLDWNFIAWGLVWCGLVAHNSSDLSIMSAVRVQRVMDMKEALLKAAKEESLEEVCSMVPNGGRLNVAFHTYHHSGFGMRKSDSLAHMQKRSAGEVARQVPMLIPAQEDGLIRGGLWAESDAFADCRTYTQGLAKRVEQEYGATVRYNTRVDRLLTEGSAMAGVKLQSGEVVKADIYVLAAGVDTPTIAVTAGVHVPITAMRGYKVIVPLKKKEAAPKTAVCCKPYELYVTPLHDDIHFASFGEFAPHWDRTPTKELEQRLDRLVKLVFPQIEDIAHWDRREHVFGRRPQTPDGNPVVGPTRVTGLYINAGHCSYGFRGATHTAQLLCNGLRNGFVANGIYERICTLSRYQFVRETFAAELLDTNNYPHLEELGKDRRGL